MPPRASIILALILLFAGYTTLYTVVDPSRDAYTEPPPIDEAMYQRLWGFAWSEGLDISTTQAIEARQYNGSTILVAKISFALKPELRDCRVYAWIYTSGGPPGERWIVLVHGLGGDHTFFEKPMGGDPPLAYELALRGVTVLSIDAAGHGESCIPGGESWEDLASSIEPGQFFLYYVYLSGLRAVEAALQLGAQDVAIGGVSMGGLTSLVVASIHPKVSLAIPIVASGCLTCAIQSGGLANLVGPPDMPVDDRSASLLSHADPLSYITRAAEQGTLEGKTFYILFSGHDEYFPLEGLEYTVARLEEGGARVYVAIDGNNNHYTPGKGWTDSVLNLAGLYSEGMASEAFQDSLPPSPRPSALLLGSEWRPAADGLAFLPPLPLIPVFLGGEALSRSSADIIVTTTLYWTLPLPLRLLVGLAFVSTAFYLANLVYGRMRAATATLLGLLAVMLAGVPFWVWPGRFSLGILGLLERYAVTPSVAFDVPTLPLLTAAMLATPLLLAASVLVVRRIASWLLLSLYILSVMAIYGLMRVVVGIIEDNAPQEIPARLLPVELGYAVLAVAALLARRRLQTARPSRGQSQGGPEVLAARDRQP